MMNRALRRRAKAKQKSCDYNIEAAAVLRGESTRMLDIDIVPACDIPYHRHAETMIWIVGQFLKSVSLGKRTCIGCKHLWTTEQPWPAGFMFVRAWGEPKHWAVFGICPECWTRDLIGVRTKMLEEIAPGGQMLDESHDAPRGVQ